MKKYLKTAAKAWAGATLNVKRFADAWYAAVSKHGDEAIEAFRAAYPMFGDREWKRIGMIADGRLLPQLFFKSDYFIGKILNLNGSMRFQKALVGASNDGRIRVDRGNGPEKVTLADLTKGEEKALAMLLSEENEKLSKPELRTKYKMLITKINKSNRHHKPAWSLRCFGGRTVAQINRACKMELGDMEALIEGLKYHKPENWSRPSHDILIELVDAVCELESLRDDEWEFEEKHGPYRDCWDDKVGEEHDELLGDIQNARDKVKRLCREATGNDKLEV